MFTYLYHRNSFLPNNAASVSFLDFLAGNRWRWHQSVSAINIDSVKINTSLIMMKECVIHSLEDDLLTKLLTGYQCCKQHQRGGCQGVGG